MAIKHIQDDLRRYLVYGLAASLLVHTLLALLLNPQAHPLQTAPIMVDIVLAPQPPEREPEAPQSQRQIVSPPDAKQESALPVSSRLESDKNVKVAKEQVKRGDGPDAGTALGKNAPAPRSPQRPRPEHKQQQAAASNRAAPLRTLKLDSETLHEKFGAGTQALPQRSLNEEIMGGPSAAVEASSGAAYQAFSRPLGSGAAFLGSRGSVDFLPNLPDGDITLLNTKANKFAVFVRRVATQVFGQLRAQGWESLRATDIGAIRDYSVVRAVLSPKGDLLRIEAEGQSGSQFFDEVLLNATRKGARDPNPPKDAVASDGNYHFIFKAKSWSRPAVSARSGFPVERRWLLLATGLE